VAQTSSTARLKTSARRAGCDVAGRPNTATGRLFSPPLTRINTLWVLEPETGQLYPDDTLPLCGVGERCAFSPDQQWALRQGESLIVSRPDGSQATVLFRPEEKSEWPQDFSWIGQHTLQYPTRARAGQYLNRCCSAGASTSTGTGEPFEQAISCHSLSAHDNLGRQPGRTSNSLHPGTGQSTISTTCYGLAD
jgi:hypothetical protein